MKSLSLIFILCLFISCSKNPEERGITVFDDMVHSPAYEAFSVNELTPDGKTMLEPVLGSIARGKMPHPYTSSEEDAIRAGIELVDPYQETSQSLKRGEYLYTNYCVSCHGVAGEGDGPITRKKFPAPPSLKTSKYKRYSKGRIYHVITAGFGDMASHAAQISREDRWYLTHYVKHFQK